MKTLALAILALPLLATAKLGQPASSSSSSRIHQNRRRPLNDDLPELDLCCSNLMGRQFGLCTAFVHLGCLYQNTRACDKVEKAWKRLVGEPILSSLACACPCWTHDVVVAEINQENLVLCQDYHKYGKPVANITYSGEKRLHASQTICLREDPDEFFVPLEEPVTEAQAYVCRQLLLHHCMDMGILHEEGCPCFTAEDLNERTSEEGQPRQCYFMMVDFEMIQVENEWMPMFVGTTNDCSGYKVTSNGLNEDQAASCKARVRGKCILEGALTDPADGNCPCFAQEDVDKITDNNFQGCTFGPTWTISSNDDPPLKFKVADDEERYWCAENDYYPLQPRIFYEFMDMDQFMACQNLIVDRCQQLMN